MRLSVPFRATGDAAAAVSRVWKEKILGMSGSDGPSVWDTSRVWGLLNL